MPHYEETEYGFDYGCARINRLCSDDEKGWVVLGITTPKRHVQVYITKTGKIRIYSNGEWTPPEMKGT